jgi:hypothetical protein
MAIEMVNKKQWLLMKHFVNVNKLEPLSFTYVQLHCQANKMNQTKPLLNLPCLHLLYCALQISQQSHIWAPMNC